MAKESLSRYALARWGMQPNTSYDDSLVFHHLSSVSAYYTIFHVTAWLRLGPTFPRVAALLLTQVVEKVHLQRIRQFRRGPEREVDVARGPWLHTGARRSCAARARSATPPAVSSGAECGEGKRSRFYLLPSFTYFMVDPTRSTCSTRLFIRTYMFYTLKPFRVFSVFRG